MEVGWEVDWKRAGVREILYFEYMEVLGVWFAEGPCVEDLERHSWISRYIFFITGEDIPMDV